MGAARSRGVSAVCLRGECRRRRVLSPPGRLRPGRSGAGRSPPWLRYAGSPTHPAAEGRPGAAGECRLSAGECRRRRCIEARSGRPVPRAGRAQVRAVVRLGFDTRADARYSPRGGGAARSRGVSAVSLRGECRRRRCIEARSGRPVPRAVGQVRAVVRLGFDTRAGARYSPAAVGRSMLTATQPAAGGAVDARLLTPRRVERPSSVKPEKPVNRSSTVAVSGPAESHRSVVSETSPAGREPRADSQHAEHCGDDRQHAGEEHREDPVRQQQTDDHQHEGGSGSTPEQPDSIGSPQ